jgi:diguanylate cyclase (GGDEF)-like protein
MDGLEPNNWRDRGASRLARIVPWPSGPLRRIRLVFISVLFIVMAAVVVAVGLAAAAGDAPLWPVCLGCVFALGLLTVQQYPKDELSVSVQALQLLLMTGVCLTDAAVGAGAGVAQFSVIIAAMYGSSRQCMAQCVLFQLAVTMSVLVKGQLGLDPGVTTFQSSSSLLGMVALTGMTYAVASVVRNHERTVARDRVVLGAGAALVAAQARENIYTSVFQAATALIQPTGEKVIVAMQGDNELVVIMSIDGVVRAGGGTRLPFSELPDVVRVELERRSSTDEVLEDCLPLLHVFDGGEVDGVLMSLGHRGEAPVLLMVTSGRKLSKHVLIGLRTLEPTVELALRNAELTEGLRRLAFKDPLTGLANRARFNERLEEALEPDRSGAGQVGLLLLDLDGFKGINDSFGHAAGDGLLVTTAGRLNASVRPGDTVARLGGDEFVVLLEGLGGMHDALAVADQVLAALNAPSVVAGTAMVVEASIGVAVNDPADLGAEQLLAHADLAMYLAKGEGKGCCRAYHPDLHSSVVEQRILETELRQALERREFAMVYQPIRRLSTGRIDGVEGLVRWHHPSGSRLEPEEFLAVVEQAGLTIALGRWVFTQACQDAQLWPSYSDGQAVNVSVNLSAKQLADSGLIGAVRIALDSSQLRPDRLVVEVSETVLLQDPVQADSRLRELRALGVRIAMDNVGSSYLPLRRLDQSLIDFIKLDRGVIDRVTGGSVGSAVVATTLDLAERFGVQCVAVGVDDPEQLAELRRLECELVQGFHLDSPMPAEQILHTLRAPPAGVWPAAASISGAGGTIVATRHKLPGPRPAS